MHFGIEYLLLGLFIYGMNVIPVFMPPTWIVLAFFYHHYHLAFVPTVIIGATTATFGRVTLAYLARHVLHDKIPKSWTKNYDDLGAYVKSHQKLTIPVMLTYAFFPISSNYVYIMAGLSGLPINIIAISFFIGRLISYSFWISAASFATRHLEDIFQGHLVQSQTIIFEIAGLLVVWGIGRIPWKKILPK